MEIKKIFLPLIIIITIISCTNKFKAPDNSVDPNNQKFSDTSYVQQFPVWTGFNKPQDIIIGKETFVYVADTYNDRIVMMNVAGQILGTKSVKRPVAIDQDYRLNLVVCAQFDTTINGINSTYSAVYKIDLYSAGHNLENAKMTRILPKTSFDFLRSDREYTGVCVFFDNSYYVSRRGPANTSKVDPDNVILTFGQIKVSNGVYRDTLTGRVPLLEPLGTGLMSSNQISSLTAFKGNKYDMIVTMIGNNSFKSQWLRYVSNLDFTGYENYLEPFYTNMMKVNKFGKPEDVALDNYNNIYIADAEKDSIFKFNSFGDELQSFGGSKIFKSPHAVAFHDKTLYVADTENNRILRFILSTDID